MSSDMSSPAGVPTPAARRSSPALAFLLALVALGAIAIATLRTPVRIVTGLPDDLVVAKARDELHGRLAVETGGLRFTTALPGDGGTPDVALATEFAEALRAARAPAATDPRRLAALGALDLAANRLEGAERMYREAVDLAPSYGEARLGLGITLALAADAEPDQERARGLRLRAISQCAAVPEADPGYLSALFDRALLLARAGREDEARRWAQAYAARDPGSPWALALERELNATAR